MLILLYPGSDTDRLLLLQRIRETGGADTAVGQEYLPQRMRDDVAAREALMLPHYEALDAAKEGRSQEIEERNTAAERLEAYVRAFREVVIWKQKLEGLPDSYLRFFGIGSEQITDNKVYAWIDVANRYLKGETDAMAAGHTAVAYPTAVSLQTARDQALAEAKDVDTADRSLDLVQQALADLRPATDKLIRAISAQLNASLYDLPVDDIRRIKRTYGYVYIEATAPIEGEAVAETENI